MSFYVKNIVPTYYLHYKLKLSVPWSYNILTFSVSIVQNTTCHISYCALIIVNVHFIVLRDNANPILGYFS
jgi:hypothetical protein